MPTVHDSGVRLMPGPGGPILERAGFHPDHGVAIQGVADSLERMIVSRCAATVAIGLLDEGYSSKGFGIKAKSCDWGPFAGFAMSDIQYAKYAGGATRRAWLKQDNFFRHGQSDTGFAPTDSGGAAAVAGLRHSSMAAPDVLKLSARRLRYLAAQRVIRMPELGDYRPITCDSPYGEMEFRLARLPTGSDACWGILHRNVFGFDGDRVVMEDGGVWNLVRAMTNTAPSGSSSDPNRQCCAGDYDLWGVFPRKNSSVASTRSLAEHGMDRQMQIFASANPSAQGGIQARVRALQAATRNQVVARTQKGYGEYKEDREKGNISALTLHTARAINKAIRLAGYRGGDMVHHNDDMGNPFRSDVEEELIAFVPGEAVPQFIISTTSGRGAEGSIGWNEWIELYKAEYKIYDNPAIWRSR